MGGRGGRFVPRPRPTLTEEQINGCLRDKLRDYNDRDTEATNRHIQVLRDALELISGSASDSIPETKLDLTVKFIEHLVGEILRRGGGLVILAADDSATLDPRGVPRIFDWVALRKVERYAESTTEGPRKCARVVMPDHFVASRLNEGNLRTLSNLQQRGVVEVERIRREEYTGGRYREPQVEPADAMVAIGGG